MDWIGELCLALAHRWDPGRLFVIFTAYFDESDTTDDDDAAAAIAANAPKSP